MYLNPSTSEFIDLQFEDIFVERTEMLEALADMVNMPGSSKGVKPRFCIVQDASFCGVS